ncbi:hypothetical protein NW768_010630 [Fusarium equiseti]|uniref:Uncharacterized protein n=1 Tax=Fusarium equiseti TaxID=61235 RepID=A0ABQ8QZV7_FUSEQ|nr:hypothetical protein NW768_010630 [Fusarium equiseti]
MRPVHADEAETLVTWKPMIILDKTLYGPAYIESLVAQNPGLVTSKTNGRKTRKTLPLEIWHMILEIITNDPGSHDFALLRANHIELGDSMGQTLACNKINRWKSLGTLRNEYEVEEANGYLARPDLAFRYLPNPFHLGDVSRTWEIPTRVFSSRIKSLHVQVAVHDFIKYLEGGRCNLCSNKRTVMRELSTEVNSQHDFSRLRFWMYISVMCPVCVGLHATKRCTEAFRHLRVVPYFNWLREQLIMVFGVEDTFDHLLAGGLT